MRRGEERVKIITQNDKRGGGVPVRNEERRRKRNKMGEVTVLKRRHLDQSIK
jgi:hypothetical protein